MTIVKVNWAKTSLVYLRRLSARVERGLPPLDGLPLADGDQTMGWVAFEIADQESARLSDAELAAKGENLYEQLKPHTVFVSTPTSP